MLKNLKKVAAIVLSFAMAVQFGLADSYYVNAVEEPVEPQQQEETTTTAPQEQEQVPTTEEETPQQQEEYAPAAEETNEQSAPETKSVELSYVAEDGTVLHETASRDFNLDYSLKTDSSVMLNFDGYTLKDVIINNSQTVPADQANLSVTSDLVSVKFVYVSVNTKEDKQTSENNEQTKTEEANEDDAEADPETKEELPEYPAFDQSETAGNVVVHATAAEGVLPRDSKLVVKRITRKAILNAVEDTVSEKNKEMDSAVALDITIQNKDGVEIQPNGSVNISFENAAVSGDEINIYHVTDDASAVTEVATNTQSFDANHFSIYVITGENDVKLTTFNFVDAKGKPVSTQIVKTGDTLITPTAPDVAGKAFVGWVDEAGNPFTGFGKQAEITETRTRTITAKYENALYVYFYNPEGTQIMRTEKVGDHEEHDFTTVSYDVDATHKLVGWAAERKGTENIADRISVRADQTSVNVYAIIKEGHWVTFDSYGGSAIDSQFVLNGDNLVLDKNTTPTKPGYTFDGWYNGLSKVENGATVTSPMTLTAHWEAAKVNYTINYWQQKVTDDKNATDAQKTYEYVSAETKKATTGTNISATNSKKYKGFTYNANNSSKDVEISGDGTTIINVYYDRVLCTVNFYEYESTGWLGGRWKITKYETGLYGANLPEGTWDSSSYWTVEEGGGTGCILLTSFDFETAGYANNQGNITTNGVVTTCNFYRQGKSGSASVHYYNEQADGSYKLVQTIKTGGGTLTVHEKYVGYDLYKYTTAKNPGTSSSYWEKQKDVYDGKRLGDYPISIASKLKTYSLSYYNYNGVANTEENIKYTASLESYANYTPEKPSGLPEYYEFGGWYKDEACTTKFDFSKETMPNANLQIYAKWTAKKIKLTYNLNTPDGTSRKVDSDVDAGTIASTVLPSVTTTSDYSFAGWYYADGNGNITKDAFNVNEAITKNTNVIGKWLYNGELKVVYDPGTEGKNAKVPTDSNIYAGGAKVTVAKNATTTSKKKFLGWKLKESLYYPGDAFEVNKDIANKYNQIILTATWGNAETSTTLTYDPGNGSGTATTVDVMNNKAVEIKAHDSDVLGFTAPEAEGKEYYFAGWADSKTGNATYADGQTINIDANGENVLYAVWIEKRVIILVANSGTVTYNGQMQEVNGFESLIIDGYTVSGLSAYAQGTDAGTYPTKITGTAHVEKDNQNVTNKVIVKTRPGTLTITRQSIDPGTDPEKPNPDYIGAKVNSPSDKVYDGNEHKWIPTVTDKADKKLEAGTAYTVEYSTENFKDVGTIDVTITGIGNYTGTVTRTYKVTPKEYTVTTDSATKTYSATALTAGGKVEGIVSGETVEFTTTGSQTEVGTSKNTYELVWKSAKATNYTLAKESIGKLTVKAKSIVPDDKDTPESEKTGITVNEPSDSKYDGKEHKEVLTVTDTKTGKELVAGTDYSVTYSSDLVNAGTVTMKVAGLGNYTGSFTKTYKITKRSVTLTSATVSKVYDGSALTNTSITVSGDGFVEGEGASYEVTGTQTEVGNSANAFEYKLNEKTLASNYNITKVVGTLTITAAPAPVTPATPSTPSTPSSTTSTTPRTLSAPQVTTPVETVEKETTPKAEPKKEEKVEEEYTPKASPQYYWALINLICAILTVLFGLLLLISKRHKDEDDDEEDDETKQQTTNDDEEKEQEKKRGLFTRVLAVLIAIVSVVFFLVTEDLSLPWTWTDQWTIWMVVIGLVQIVVFFVGRKWKNVDNDDEDEEAQQA